MSVYHTPTLLFLVVAFFAREGFRLVFFADVHITDDLTGQRRWSRQKRFSISITSSVCRLGRRGTTYTLR
jgi:hypothetical protein